MAAREHERKAIAEAERADGGVNKLGVGEPEFLDISGNPGLCPPR